MDYSIFDKTFWDAWIQKLLRNIASMKYQWLLLLYIPVVYGMFEGKWINNNWISIIPIEIGLGFLFGSFLTVFTMRIYAKTKLTEENDMLDTDK